LGSRACWRAEGKEGCPGIGLGLRRLGDRRAEHNQGKAEKEAVGSLMQGGPSENNHFDALVGAGIFFGWASNEEDLIARETEF